jgi:cytochrome P450
MKDLSSVDIRAPENRPDPYPLYASLREAGGIMWNTHAKAWVVSKHEYVRALLSHPHISVGKMEPFKAQANPDVKRKIEMMQQVMQHWVVFKDPPDHTRVRKVLQKGFMPRAILRMEASVRDITVMLLDRIKERSEIEFLEDFGYRLPATVVCDLFAVPREDYQLMHAWSEDLSKFVLGSPDRNVKYDTTLKSLADMNDYFSALVERRIAGKSLRQGQSPDLLDQLIASCDEPDGLSKEEIIATLVLAVFGGHETTAHMLANAVRVLAMNKDKLRELAADPAKIPAAVEELMRFDGPAPIVTRVCGADVEMAGQLMKRGQRVLLILHAANHDPAAFESPEKIDFARGKCPHLQFGNGAHFCLGAPLARLEGKVALEELIRRYEDFELLDYELSWHDELMVRAPKAMRIRLVPRSAGGRS